MFNLGDMAQIQNQNIWKKFYREGIRVLERTRVRFPARIYRLGSVFKKMEMYDDSRKWFKILLRKPEAVEFYGGAHFHLGEISMIENKQNSAEYYLKKCLEYTPDHQKALDYLSSLEKRA